MKDCAIWDLDMTLAESSHRLHLIVDPQARPDFRPDWEAFHALTHLDPVIEAAATTFRALHASGIVNVVASSRPEANRQKTSRWMLINDLWLPPQRILLRENGDHRPSLLIKREMLERIRSNGLRPVMAYEDHPEVVAMYRAEGVFCWAAPDDNWRSGAFREAPQAPATNGVSRESSTERPAA